MSDSWVTRAVSSNSTPVEISEDILNEKGVILLQGSNHFGDPIYSYLQLTIRSLEQLRNCMRRGDKFLPADFGEVIAAGKGEPSAELRSEMAVTYNLVDTPRGKQQLLDSKGPYGQGAQEDAAHRAALEAVLKNQSPKADDSSTNQSNIWED